VSFPLYIAKRYLFSKSKNNAINIITRIASVGIIVGALSLFVVLSVFSGLREFSLSFSNDFDPDLKVNPASGKSFFITSDQEQKLQNISSIESYSKIIEERVLFSFAGKQQIATLKGIDKNYVKTNKSSEKLFNGSWLKPNTYQVVVGYGISEKLSMGLFDYNNTFEVMAPKPGIGDLAINPEDSFTKSVLIPVGIYAINEELDSKFVFSDLGLAQELFQYQKNQVSGIDIKTKPDTDKAKTIEEIKIIFDNNVEVNTRAQLNATLYKMLNTENIIVYLIFTLVIIIALFNLVGALIMMILDKKANLKTLFNLGTEVKNLRKIFLLQGTLLSVFGGLIGLLLGVIIVLVQQQFQLIMITDSLAYPVKFVFQNVLIVLATICALGFIASLIASSRVSKKLLE
jgi:lipoprotein-releasing system permease protein